MPPHTPAQTDSEESSLDSQEMGIKAAVAPLLQELEDCREVLPLVPLLEIIGNGRTGWRGGGSGRIHCNDRPDSDPAIYIDCSTASFVDCNWKPVEERQLLALVAESFSLKDKIQQIMASCLDGYLESYDPGANRSEKMHRIETQLRKATEALHKIYGIE